MDAFKEVAFEAFRSHAVVLKKMRGQGEPTKALTEKSRKEAVSTGRVKFTPNEMPRFSVGRLTPSTEVLLVRRLPARRRDVHRCPRLTWRHVSTRLGARWRSG